MKLSRIVILIPLWVSCANPPDAKKECPEAVKRGFTGPALVPCARMAIFDRRTEFVKANKLTATCDDRWESSVSVECNGVTHTGVPVKFKCDCGRCEFIPQWLW